MFYYNKINFYKKSINFSHQHKLNKKSHRFQKGVHYQFQHSEEIKISKMFLQTM